ncbi:MAG: triose-phosphate isomerase [Thermoproteota archaeon]|jgi:triosephosphate isomerase|nr:triose-phosphate isomerase [Thermoproteota archaeon]
MFFLNFPLFLINFKCYEEAIGDNAKRLALASKKISEELNIDIFLAPIYTDIREISKLNVKVFAQGADPVEPGSYTAHVPLEAIKAAGAIGVIINHSEKRLNYEAIEFLVKKCKKLSLISLVCGASVEECLNLAKIKPDIIAIEPPELIGTGKSVSKYKPESILMTVKLVKEFDKNIHVICGAGISNAEDVSEALKLGAEGILVSSSIVKAENQEEKIRELALVFKSHK